MGLKGGEGEGGEVGGGNISSLVLPSAYSSNWTKITDISEGPYIARRAVVAVA